ENVLGRPAEPAGQQYWTGVLASGQSRGKVVLHFSNSAENRAKVAAQVDVTNLFIDMLERAPTSTELAAALEEVRTTSLAAFAAGIITSEEYGDRIDALA
ncbi:MAG TPA: DUF4214 domain-containing protein, partial [Iamia sp.]|nr:DUF4214 domain-containing protein [Iamia sp.]